MLGELLWLIFGGGYIGGKIVSEQTQIARSKRDPFWWSSKNYNLERQGYYEQMVVFEKEKAEKLLGRPVVINSIKAKREAVTELLAKEGIDYHDIHEAAAEEARAKGWKSRW